VAIHGYPRATIDIDLLIRPESEDAVYAAAAPLGYAVRAKPMHFAQSEIRRVSKIDPADGEVLMLDLLLVTPLIDHVWETREHKMWLGREITVVSREGLVALKRARGSKQDLADIEKLES